MYHHLIWWLNRLFLLLIGVLIASGVAFAVLRKSPTQPPLLPRPVGLPTTSFCPKEYGSFGSSGLQLAYQPPKLGVPDLRKALHYRGYNMRPDAKGNEDLFFSVGNSEEVFSVPAKAIQYLILKDNPDIPYAPSPENRSTSLWFVPELRGGQVSIQVRMKDEKGETVGGEQEKGNFTLSEKPLSAQNKTFMIDSLRADPSLLARQKARWYGSDQFLEDHGGEAFEKAAGKQRIVFGEGDALYAVYVDKGDFLIWKEGRWQAPVQGESTQGYPLLRINKIEDRVMNGELFDVSGKIKVNVNLIRLSEPPLPPQAVTQAFQFLGRRTKVHSLFKLNNKREIVGPEDWFLLTQEGWKKLKSQKEIDAYVEGKLQGSLFILNDISELNEDKWLEGTLYSRFRSQSEQVALPLRTTIREPLQEAPVKREEVNPILLPQQG